MIMSDSARGRDGGELSRTLRLLPPVELCLLRTQYPPDWLRTRSREFRFDMMNRRTFKSETVLRCVSVGGCSSQVNIWDLNAALLSTLDIASLNHLIVSL
jgi:hypothetical protein